MICLRTGNPVIFSFFAFIIFQLCVCICVCVGGYVYEDADACGCLWPLIFPELVTGSRELFDVAAGN